MSDVNITIGNYQIISPIARGAFGRVYLARHRVLSNRLVALKLMHAIPFSSAQEHEQFLQEARMLERLKHPYILPVLDVGVHEEVPYIVSEYASGDSLRQRLLRRDIQPLSFEETQTILSQIGLALQYVHEQGIIHRDVKPENILFNARGEALLADFGIATTLTAASMKSTTSAGTPRYMSPEQFQGKASKESDQYSLACIAYELFTGRPPFDGADSVILMYQHINTAPAPLKSHNPQLAPETEQAVLKALSKDRHERYPNVLEFLAALQYTEITLLKNPTPAFLSTFQSLQEVVPHATDFSMRPIETEKGSGKGEFIEQTKSILLFPSGGRSQVDAVPSALKQGKDNATILMSLEEHRFPQPLSKDLKRLPKGLLIAVLSAFVLTVTISGSLFWIFRTTTSASVNAHAQSSSALSSRPGHTASSSLPQSVPLTSTPTQSAKKMSATITSIQPTHPQPTLPANPSTSVVPTPTPIPVTGPGVPPAPKPVPMPSPTPAPFSINYYLCGDQAHLVNPGAWHTVQPGTVVSDPAYSGPVNSYTGPAGDPNNSAGSCSGRYQWAWDNSQVEADWIWTNAHLPNGHCQVVVHIPSWYAGAPDAHYTLTVASDTTSVNYTFDKQNQNQVSTTWISLLVNGQIPALAMPPGTNSTYTLTLSLFNGGTVNWYLGADAIKFVCTAQ